VNKSSFLVIFFVYISYHLEPINRVHQRTGPSLIGIPSTIRDRSQINETIASLIKEAKLMRDPCFEFLWRMQKVMQPFADTAGGQTTCLRSLKTKKKYE